MRKLLAMLVAALMITGMALAQEKKEKKASDEKKVSGDIVSIDDAKSTITLTKSNVMTTLHFNASTKWTKQEGGKPVDAKREDFKANARVICMAKPEGKEWVATHCDLRPVR